MVYIMSDIHGRKDRFDDVLKQVILSENDTLYILGDVIDRNPDGITLLKYIMSKPNIKMLLGNHEYMMLNALKNEDAILIFGHTPTIHYQDCSPMQIWYKDNLIGIDCGAAYPEGRRACLRLEDMKEFYSN